MDKWHQNSISPDLWEKINHAFETGQVIKGFVKDAIKGGFVVDLLGIDAFLPGSQIELKRVNDFVSYMGSWLDLQVVKINAQDHNIVVSHRAILEKKLESQKAEIFKKIEKGQIFEGTVKNLSILGVFVDFGGVDGLIHISDLCWRRIKHPEEFLELGQKVNVVVLDCDVDSHRISLGLKQLTQNPWEAIPEHINTGAIVKGRVAKFLDYGVFIEIYPGIEGLLHISEMSWSTHLKSPNECLNLGDEIEAKVLNIERGEHKLSLGLKQLTPDPWADVEKRYPVGSKHSATVRSMANFGLFLEFEPGVDGLLHKNDFSSTQKFTNPFGFAEIGEKIEVIILNTDKDKRRLILGQKQLQPNPWDILPEFIKEGSIVKGSVVEIKSFGIILSILPGIEGMVQASEMSWFKLISLHSFIKLGQETEAKILNVDKGNRKLSLSLKQATNDPWPIIEERYAVGSKHTGIVTKIVGTNVFIEIGPGIEGIIHENDFSLAQKIMQPAKTVDIGEKTEVVVLHFNEKKRIFNLGHKQLNKTPWDIYEGTFTIGSIHKGTIEAIDINGTAIVKLVSGFNISVSKKQLLKVDGSYPNVKENINFRVKKFDKVNCNIILSHKDTWSLSKKNKIKLKKSEIAVGTAKNIDKEEPEGKNYHSSRKITLGDSFEVLKQLKSQMEQDK